MSLLAALAAGQFVRLINPIAPYIMYTEPGRARRDENVRYSMARVASGENADFSNESWHWKPFRFGFVNRVHLLAGNGRGKNRHGTMEVANEPPRGRMVSSITDRKGTGNARLYRASLPSWLNAPRRNTRRYTLDFLTLFVRYCLLGCQRSVHTW